MKDTADTRSKDRLRLWLQLLRLTRATENRLRGYLREEHGTTLPRFDVMAELARRPDGVTMSELSRMLLVSNGNATAVVDRLIAEGLVRRETPPSDRRSVIVALTDEGRRRFAALARGHEAEVAAHFANLGEADVAAMAAILKRMREGVAA